MSKIKILFLSLILGLSALAAPVLAQETPPATTPVIVAMVNISNAKIVNQVGNNFNISFTISNGEGVQSNVKYGIRLLKKEAAAQAIVDQKTYDESFTLPENSSFTKEIIYSAPESLSGAYTLLITSSNSNGFPFATVSLGEVKLSPASKGVEISSSSCRIVTSSNAENKLLSEIVDVYTEDTMKVLCLVNNQTTDSVAISPVFETRDRSAYGELTASAVEQFNAPTTLKPLEKKAISVVVPKVKDPGMYTFSLAFVSGAMKSNSVSASYRVGGGTSEVINISPDADYYGKGESAKILLLWSGTNAASAEAVITKQWNRVCGSVSTTALAKGKDTLVVPIKKNCFNPTITVTLKAADGTVLDKETVAVPTTSREEDKGLFSTAKGAILLVVLLIAVAALGVYLKRKGLNKTGTIVSMLVVGISLALIPFSQVSANTYIAGPGNNIFVTVNLDHLPSSPNQTPGVYTPGESIRVSGQIQSNDDAYTYLTMMSAITVGNASVDLFMDPVALLPLHTIFGDTQQLTAPGCGQASCSYDVNFTTSLNQVNNPPGNSCSAYVRFIGTFRFGGVIWLGPAQHPSVTAQVAIVGNAARGITTNDPYDLYSFTIPANAQKSVMGEFYGVEGFDHGWVVSTDLSWACGDQNQNYSTCFIADTQVDMADGTKKNIQDVKIGDVLKGETSNNTVVGFHRPTLDGKLYSFNGGRFFVTEEHPFKTTEGWKSINPKKTALENIGIEVTDLKVGDTLVTDHGLEKIYSIESKEESKDTPLYNFKLSGDHTYYADGYLVHNKQECDGSMSCTNNIACVEPYSGYRITSPLEAGVCPSGCRYPGLPDRPFCYGYYPYTTSRYCPTPQGACTN